MPLHPLKEEWDADVRGGDPLAFPGFSPPARESVVTGRTDHYAVIEGQFDVMGGSMGAAHGERVVRAYRRAIDASLPIVVLARSGGARMQEGMVSLVQLARTAAAAAAHSRAGLLSLAVLRGPTTGGVYASYASLADLKAAEAGALVGFAGPRVVELTTGSRLPADSHTAESAYAAGLVDAVVSGENEQRAWVEAALGMSPSVQPTTSALPAPSRRDHSAWASVLAARDDRRPRASEVVAAIFDRTVALHGVDRCIRAWVGSLNDRRVVIVGMEGDRPTPAGYRLARRAIALADRLGLPLFTLVDTPGADPGPVSEAAGIAGEIAATFAAMSELRSSSVSVCIGEGGSGGALALAFADRLLMLDYAIFSVIAPEGAAAILDRNVSPERVARRAAELRLTADDMAELGIADRIVSSSERLDEALVEALEAAHPGDRLRRFDAATHAWIREPEHD